MEKMENVIIKTLSNSFAKKEAEKLYNTGAVFLLFFEDGRNDNMLVYLWE